MWSKAEEFLLRDKYIGPLVKKWGHCEIKARVHVDYFQALAGAIIGQQLSGRVADVIYDRLKKKIGGRLTPKKLLLVPEQELRDCGMSWAKVRSVRDLAQRVIAKELHIRKLNTLPDEEVMQELVAVKGIGKWTAEMFLMFTLARADIFPVDDLGIRKGFEKITGKKLEKEKLAKFSERWKPYRTVASWYIWRSLDNR